MNSYHHAFSQRRSDYLLERRALGDGLSDEAYEAIEALFAERGEALPARPLAPRIVGGTATDGMARKGLSAEQRPTFGDPRSVTIHSSSVDSGASRSISTSATSD